MFIISDNSSPYHYIDLSADINTKNIFLLQTDSKRDKIN